MLEAMQKALIKMNIDEKTACELVQQSMPCSKMVVENPQIALSTLRENVTQKRRHHRGSVSRI